MYLCLFKKGGQVGADSRWGFTRKTLFSTHSSWYPGPTIGNHCNTTATRSATHTAYCNTCSTHAYYNTCTRIHTHAPKKNVYVHIRTHIHTQNSHWLIQGGTHTHTHTHKHSHTHTHTHTHTHIHTHTQTDTHTHPDMHARARTHTHIHT